MSPHPASVAPLGLTYLRLVLVPALWGGIFVAGRLVSADLPPATAGFIRFLLATAALAVALHLTQGLGELARATRRQWLHALGLSVSGILLYNLFFFYALSLLPASRTSLFVALSPVVTLLMAMMFMGERPSAVRWVGMALALLGVAIVVTQGQLAQVGSSFGPGELSILGAVIAWAVYTLHGGRLLTQLSPMATTLMAAAWGTVLLGLAAIPELPRLSPQDFNVRTLGGLAYAGILGTAVAFVWYYHGIIRLGAARTVVFNNLVPVFGVLLGWLVLGEPITPSLLSGGALAVVGVFLVNRSKR